MKTASRILGSAFFREGFEVQDAPRYGAERRGAPIFAYVRADRAPIHERGVIAEPDLVVVADDSLMQVPSAGIREGLDSHAVLLIRTRQDAATWRTRMGLAGEVVTAPVQDGDPRSVERFVGVRCVGAAARMLGVISRAALQGGVTDELASLGPAIVQQGLEAALTAYDSMTAYAGCVAPRATSRVRRRPDWIDLPFEPADVSAPVIHAGGTSATSATGLWRTLRPVIDHAHCHRCHWMCALPCPDSAIRIDAEGYPRVDLEHCKGCMICVAQCPFHVIEAVPEHRARAEAN